MEYQSTSEDTRRAYLLGFVYVVLAILLAVMLFKIWPPTPWPSGSKVQSDAELAKALSECACPQPSPTSTPALSPTPASEGAISPATSPAVSPRISPAGSPASSPAASPTSSPAASPVASPSPSPAVSPSPSDDPARMPIKILGWCLLTTFDERLLLLVIIAGMLGAFVHGSTSLADYIGNNRFNRTWTWFYLLRPVIGMALALVFYFVIRGGFLTTSGGAKDINPYGIAALAGLVGMFSKQATDKLGEVFGTLFRSAEGEGDAKRKDPLKTAASAVTIKKIDPPEIVAGTTGNSIKVTGSSFSSEAKVWLNDKPQNTKFENAETLTADIANDLAIKPAIYKLKVVNSKESESATVDFRVVGAGGIRAASEKPVTGEGGDDDLIDGCDVELKADTADEELPITEGGVK